MGQRLRIASLPRSMHNPAMPAPLDWTSCGGLDAVKMLCQEIGPTDAARRLNLSPAHAEALRRKCSRGKWLDEVRPVEPAKPIRTQPIQRNHVVPALVPGTSSAVPSRVPLSLSTAPTASEALAAVLADDSRQTRLGLSKGITKAAQHVSELTGAQVLKQSQGVKHLAGAANLIHGWNDAKATGSMVALNVAISVSGMEIELATPVEIEAEVISGPDRSAE